MGVSPVLSADKVWVRLDCFRYRDRGPYHWTLECVGGRALVSSTGVRRRRCRNCGRAGCARREIESVTATQKAVSNSRIGWWSVATVQTPQPIAAIFPARTRVSRLRDGGAGGVSGVSCGGRLTAAAMGAPCSGALRLYGDELYPYTRRMVRQWFMPTRRGDARAAAVSVVVFVVVSGVLAVVFGGSAWGVVSMAPFFGVVMYWWRRKQHRAASSS